MMTPWADDRENDEKWAGMGMGEHLHSSSLPGRYISRPLHAKIVKLIAKTSMDFTISSSSSWFQRRDA